MTSVDFFNIHICTVFTCILIIKASICFLKGYEYMCDFKQRVEKYLSAETDEVVRLADIIYDCMKYSKHQGIDFDTELRLAVDYFEADD